MKLEVVDTSKVVVSHVRFAKVDGFGVCFDYAVRNHYGGTCARDVLYMATARVVAARWLALLGVDHLGDLRRRESDFYVSRGDPHGGRGACSSSDYNDWISVVVMF
jgi:hypothetical protein